MAVNWLDRAISHIAPAAAARRVRSRMAFEAMARGYDGARQDRRTMGWRRSGGVSADNEIARAGPILRERMRDLVRNNPHAANAVSVLCMHLVGEGISPHPKTGNEALDKKIKGLFEKWSKKCDADGQLDFYGIQTLAVRGMIESGDGLVRRRRRRAEDKLPLPLQLEVIETDLIDSMKNEPTQGGGTVIQGIERNALGQRSAYWLFASHPGNANFDPRASLTSRAVPASEVAHVYEKQRTQVRGVPWGTPCIMPLRDLGGYEEAEQVRKRVESCLVGILVGGDESDGVGIPLDGQQKPGIYDQSGTQVDRFEPGMFAVAKGGKDIKFNTPAATSSYEAYKRSMLHTIASGFRVPYALLSGDLSEVNYSSSKIGLEVFKRLMSQVQWQIIIPMFCEPIWQWFVEAAFLAGEINTLDIPVEWSPPKFYSADPGKDVEADLAEVRAGFKPPQEAITERGRDPDAVLAKFIEWFKKVDAGKIILDSDPRHVTKAGQKQNDKADDGTTPAKPKPPSRGDDG